MNVRVALFNIVEPLNDKIKYGIVCGNAVVIRVNLERGT